MRKHLLLFFALLLGVYAMGQNLSITTVQNDEGTEFNPQLSHWNTPETDAMSIWALPSIGSTSGNTRAPGNTFRYQRTEYLITAAEMAASGFPVGSEVNSIGFLIGTAGATTQSGNFTVYLKNTADATYSLGANWDVNGFTQVSNIANWTVPIAVGSYEVPFSGGSAFTYTGGGVYVAWEFSNPAGALGTTALVALCNTNLANGLVGNRSSTAMPTALAASAFRPATIFGNSFYTDIIGLTNIYTLARNPIPYGTPTPIGVRVSNLSAAPATFDVTVTVKDATNTFVRYTSTQTVTALAAGTASIINFTGWNPSIQEEVNISAATSVIAGENWTSNNSLTNPCSVNSSLYSYNYSTTGAGGFGFTYPGTGIFAAKYTMNGQGKVTGANLVIGNSATNTGNSIYAVVLNSAGAIVAQSAAYTMVAGDIGTNKNFTFPTPPVFTDEIFYVGLAQVAGTAQYYPMGTFPESPQRDLTFYTADLIGGNVGLLPLTFNLKYGIEAQVAPNFTLPTITTLAASSITASSATLNGSVMASSNTVGVSFEYGLTTAYGTTVAGTPATVSGTTVTNVLNNLTGLLPSTTYHFRAVGTIGLFKFYGADLTFTTLAAPPTVVTLAATAIGNADATLQGTVNANGQSTATSFEYGLTTAYGTTVNGTPSTVTGSMVTPVSASISGLALSTTYHFRIKGANIGGTSNGNDMTFTTGCNIPVTAGTISGTASLCQGTNAVAYSVPAITNATTYLWVLPTGATIASGSGTNAITVNFSASAVSGNITVAGSNSCGAGTASNFAVTVNPSPMPSLTSGPVGVCVGVTGVTYQTQSGMSAYSWTISAGGSITSGAGTNTIHVNWNTVGAQTLGLSYTSAAGCAAAAPSVIPINVVSLPVPTISGPANACLGFTTNVYSTQLGMTGYNWSVSAGGTITAGAGTNAITVTWTTLGAKTVQVNYTNAEGCSAVSPSVFNVSVNPTPTPTLSGPTTLCAGSTDIVYTTQPGFSNYSWSVSYDGIITSGQNTNEVTVNWASAGLRTISVNYENALGCSAVSPTTSNVTVNSAPVPIISGLSQVCQGSTAVAYTCQGNYTGYVWTISAGGTIVSGAGTNAISVNWNVAGNQTVSVSYLNGFGCAAITPTVYSVLVDPKPANAGVILGTSPVCAGATEIMYTVAPIALADTYVWTLPAGATIVSGDNTRTIRVNFSNTASSGIIKVSGSNSCGLGASSPNFNLVVNPIPATPVITQHVDTLISSANSGNQWYLNGAIIAGATGKKHIAVYTGSYTDVVTLSGCSSAVSNAIVVHPVGIDVEKADRTFEIFPNPNNGEFNVNIETLKNEVYDINIYNSLGSLIWKQGNVSINGTFTTHVVLKDAPSGVYMVALRNQANNIVKKVVIKK
jgi:hypothetical protein